jgi:hypothetical protein
LGFVSAIDIQRQPADVVEVENGDTLGLKALGGGLGAGDGAVNPPLDPGQEVNEVIDRAARAHADDPTLHIGQGGLGGLAFHLVLRHSDSSSG